MNLKITKTKIEVNTEEFKKEVVELCELILKHNPSTFGIALKTLNSSFGIRLNDIDFYKLSEELGYTVRRGNVWYFSQILNKNE
ncbi:hypothetical protein D3C87_1501630 [compost metagenome]